MFMNVPNNSVSCLNLMILSIKERSHSYVCVVVIPGCSTSQEVSVNLC